MTNLMIERVEVSYSGADVLAQRSWRTSNPQLPKPGVSILLGFYADGGDHVARYLLVHDGIPAESTGEIDPDVRVALQMSHQQTLDPFGFLPDEFTFAELRKLHEAVAGAELQKDTFRRRWISKVDPTGFRVQPALGRNAELFRQRKDVN